MPTLFARVKKKKKEQKKKPAPTTLQEIFTGKRRNELVGFIWWTVSLLLVAALLPHDAGKNVIGPMGEILFRLGYALLGIMIYFVPVITAIVGLLIFKEKPVEQKPFKIIGLLLATLAFGILIELIFPEKVMFSKVKEFYDWNGAQSFWGNFPKGAHLWGNIGLPAGGFVAHSLEHILRTIFSVVGTYIICGTIFILSLYLLEIEPYLLNVLRRMRAKAKDAVAQTKQASTSSFGYAKPLEKKPLLQVAKENQPSSAGKSSNEENEKPKIKISQMPAMKIPEESPLKSESAGKTEALKSDKEPTAVHAKDMPETTTVIGAAEEEKDYQLPELDLLDHPKSGATISTEYFEKMSQTLETALGQFGVDAKVVEVCPGPVVTRYELQPSPGVKVSRILTLSDDIALSMRAAHVRIEAPIPGKGAIGIEIPNEEKQIVVLKELIAAKEFEEHQSTLAFSVGKDIGGQLIYGSLDSMPHLLIAGATGSGKSACINSIISSLLYRAKPNQVKFLMIDPKRVELTTYNGIPHLISPVITDSRDAAGALRLMVKEMEDRYRRLAELGVRDITAFNQRVEEEKAECAEAAEDSGLKTPVLTSMPFIVVFIDELADLMMVSANEVESTIARLAQMARAVGIHMVLATQRPSVDVITGVIKANFPSRIAFQVSSKVDSRTILDANGADALLGKGDMLYALASFNKPLRVQGVFVTTKEVDRVVRFWKKQGAPVFDESFSQEKLKASGTGTSGNGSSGGDEDELYQQAVMWVIRAKQASTSMLQRRLKIGYSRAARLVDLMEEKGIVGPPEGSKPRKVLVEDDMGFAADDPQEV